MIEVLVLSAVEDRERAARLAASLTDGGFQVAGRDIDGSDEAARSPAKPDCVIACWSAAAEIAGMAEALAAYPRERRMVARLDATAPYPDGEAVDLTSWRGGAGNPRLLLLREGIRKLAASAGDRRRMRLFKFVGGVVVIGGLGFTVDLLELPDHLCKVSALRPVCSKFGWGGVPTPEQERDYREALAGGCSGLRDFVRRADGNPRVGDAQRKLDGARDASARRWRPTERRLAMFSTGAAAAGRASAEAAAARGASDTASRLCGGYRLSPAFRVRGSAAEMGPWQCGRDLDGWRCAAPGEAVCSLEMLEIVAGEECS
ncbi:MAG TPA: hypothetical protein VEA60_15030 [Allosphingosinicella sp.]|nr:hypothetical protein [Allosphingosinicella sp.]